MAATATGVIGSPSRSQGRKPVALSLQGFQFVYRTNFFDWRLLHGIDVDTVIRLTDVKAIEDSLDTLQHGNFAAEQRTLSSANCVQLFRLLQLAVEYLAHLRSAHALLLEFYNATIDAAERWKGAARAYLEMGQAFVTESLAQGALARHLLDATDANKASLEEQDKAYNAALDTLEAEDARARHFRFRKHRTDLNWAVLHAVDVDGLVGSMDVASLERLLPNFTYGSILNEDAEQLTPHHFGQLVPLGQAALDYMLWQANATGALLEQSMATLQAACADIPMLTSATQELHNQITTLLLESQGQLPQNMAAMAALQQQQQQLQQLQQLQGLGLGGQTVSVDFGQGQLPRPMTGMRPASPALGSMGVLTASGDTQILRLGSAGGGGGGAGMGLGGYGPPRLGSAGLSGGLGGARPGSPATAMRGSNSLPSGIYDEVLALAQATAAAGGSGLPLPVVELHSKSAELQVKVESIEHELRMERSKTEEMRRILADIRDRLNRPVNAAATASQQYQLHLHHQQQQQQQRPVSPNYMRGLGSPDGIDDGSVLTSSVSQLPLYATAPQMPMPTPFASAAGVMAGGQMPVMVQPMAYGGLYMAAQQQQQQGMSPQLSPRNVAAVRPSGGGAPKVRVFLDEDAIRSQERQRAMEVLQQQVENLKAEALRNHKMAHNARRLSGGPGSSQTLQHGVGGSSDALGSHHFRAGSARHSRQPSRDDGAVRSSGGGAGPGPGGRRGNPRRKSLQQEFYSSDPELNAMGLGRGAGMRPPRPFSRLSNQPTSGPLAAPMASLDAGMGPGPSSMFSPSGSERPSPSTSMLGRARPGTAAAAAAAAGTGSGTAYAGPGTGPGASSGKSIGSAAGGGMGGGGGDASGGLGLPSSAFAAPGVGPGAGSTRSMTSAVSGLGPGDANTSGPVSASNRSTGDGANSNLGLPGSAFKRLNQQVRAPTS